MTYRAQIAAGSAALLLAVGCSGNSANVDTAGAAATAPTPAVATPAPSTQPGGPTTAALALPAKPGGLNDVPDVEVVDVASGNKVRLHSLFTGTKPVLLWFWAPH